MKKVAIQVEENIRYEDEIIVIQPNEMTDEQFEEILSKAEKLNRLYEGGANNLAVILEDLGLKVEEQSCNFPDSPRSSELEIVDVRDIK